MGLRSDHVQGDARQEHVDNHNLIEPFVLNHNTDPGAHGGFASGDGTRWNVKSYGAVGNGVDNDSAEVTAAINAAPLGAIIQFPAGRYILDNGTLNLVASRRIEGDGQYASILVPSSNTTSPIFTINITTPDPRGHINNYYGPTVRGIGLDLRGASSAIGIRNTVNSHWTWLDDVRVEGGTISWENSGANAKLTNCHFVAPTVNFWKLNNALEMRATDNIMTLLAGATIPAAIDMPVTVSGTGLFLTNLYINNSGTINSGLKGYGSSANMTTPIRATNVIFDNLSGPSWELTNLSDVMISGGWCNSAAGTNNPAVKIIGGVSGTFISNTMNGGSGASASSVEFAGGSPTNYTFVGNEVNTGVYYRLTGASTGDPINLLLRDRIGGSHIMDIASLTNEFSRLAAAMHRDWTPEVQAMPIRRRETGTRPPCGYATLGNNGEVIISHAGIAAATRARVWRERPAGTVGELYSTVTDNVVGASFKIRSTNTADRSSVYWEIFDSV